MLLSLLAIGFVLGLKHALDADHVTAVASLAARRATMGETIRIAASWGLGHAAALLVFGAVLVILGARLPDGVAHLLEAVVGFMLVILGVAVIRRARHTVLHAHGVPHAHGSRLAPRALLVGCVHGLAGTAGLVLLAVPTMESGPRALLYLAVFGAGTIAGMIGFSLLLSVSLAWGSRRLRRAATVIEWGLGLTNVALGLVIGVQSVRGFLLV